VAIAKVKIRTRTRVAMLRPREGRFSLDMMRFGDELIDAKEIEVPSSRKHASAKELDLALGLVKQLTVKEFDPSRHVDDYRTAVAMAVEKKVDAHELAEEEVERRAANQNARGGKVVDLAEMLARSMKATKGHATHARHAAPARRAVHEARPRKAAANGRHRKAS